MYNPAMYKQETASPPADILLTGHFNERYGYAVYRPRGSGSWLITYTLDGQGLYRQGELTLAANPGDIMLLQPGALHNYSVPAHGSWEFLWAHFQPRLHWLDWWQLPEVGQGLYKASIRSPNIQDRVRQAFLRCHNDASVLPTLGVQRKKSEGVQAQSTYAEPLNTLQSELALNSLEEVLLLTVRENMQAANRALDPRIQRILIIMTQNIQEQHSLESLAGEVALSPSRLAHLFKQEIGDSITNMLLHLRLNKAARLLELTSYSIKLVAEEVGFSSAFYFSRQFHQNFGVSPKAYRAAMLNKTRSTT